MSINSISLTISEETLESQKTDHFGVNKHVVKEQEKKYDCPNWRDGLEHVIKINQFLQAKGKRAAHEIFQHKMDGESKMSKHFKCTTTCYSID